MRQMRQRDLEQVRALLESIRKGLALIKQTVDTLSTALEITSGRINDWGKGDDLVKGVPEKEEPRTFEIWQPEKTVMTYSGNGGVVFPLEKIGEGTGSDFFEAVRNWLKSSLKTYLLWGDPEVIDGKVWAGGTPLFQTREEAENYSKEKNHEP